MQFLDLNKTVTRFKILLLVPIPILMFLMVVAKIVSTTDLKLSLVLKMI